MKLERLSKEQLAQHTFDATRDVQRVKGRFWIAPIMKYSGQTGYLFSDGVVRGYYESPIVGEKFYLKCRQAVLKACVWALNDLGQDDLVDRYVRLCGPEVAPPAATEAAQTESDMTNATDMEDRMSAIYMEMDFLRDRVAALEEIITAPKAEPEPTTVNGNGNE